MIVSLSNFPWVMESTVRTGGLSLHVITNFATSSSTFQEKTSTLTDYTDKPSSTRATVDQIRRYIKGRALRKQEVTS